MVEYIALEAASKALVLVVAVHVIAYMTAFAYMTADFNLLGEARVEPWFYVHTDLYIHFRGPGAICKPNREP